MAFTITITNAGRAAIVNAQNTGTAPVTIAQIGLSATAIVPAPTMTALAGELKRTGSIAGDVVADDTIHVTAMDESADVYSLRAFGLYLADGTLFAIYGQAAPILEKVAASIALLSIDVIFADIDAASITFGDASFINPPATTDRQGVVELATVAEAQAGIDALRALTPAAAKAAILGWLLAQDGSGSGLDADLLDGQHGTYYANIPARLGYTPANAAGQNFSGTVTAPGFYSISAFPSYVWRVASTGQERTVMYFDPAYEAVTIALFDTAGTFARGLAMYQSGTLLWSGNTVWHAGNDGSGSGLDADLLDGQHGSYYANIPARLGYTPANKAGETFAGGIAAPTVAIIDAANVYLGQSGGNMVLFGDSNDHLMFIKATNVWLTAVDNVAQWWIGGDGLVNARVGFLAGGNAVWHAGNDGAGSGLDADLWRGKTPAQHIADYHLSGSNANGQWRKLPDGNGGFVIEQWGRYNATVYQGAYDIDLPIAFTDADSVCVEALPINAGGNTTGTADIWCQYKSNTLSKVTLMMQDATGTANASGIMWRAIGR